MTDTISMLENTPFGHSADTPTISMIGTRAMLFEAPGAFTLACQRRIWALMDACADRADIEEVMPGVTNLMLIFSVPPEDPEAVAGWLRKAWATLPEKHIKGRLFEVGVRYGGELGSDLPRVAEHCGMSTQDVITLHQAPLYTVCALGSVPGFGYLHGLDPRLATPRKSVPSLKMLAGTVTIGGPQAGISALTGPNGWNSIGFTDLVMFDPERDPPALFAVGDQIRFYAESIEV
ncbi:5-oxoprolinase subunit PxpB [Acetobacter oryzoeni]|uniref:5-oxoprolinase subunit PxpB n=1 Tax=Acetobacter oryzoeni TaxID=2500548 RepID=A0A5B9GI25_9PROT|nr:5-oxoprolinase subunit PxpB [Acetobacter oryzoeni]MCP1203629.1 5-oxoprolinase subunit PxpB [Acetobacter oryzoeni]QEE85931.1 5-oxoprolinase subunit PxpB [Acetobacter oryzoeni]